MPFPPPSPVDGVVWHQVGPRYGPLSFADPASVDGRYSRKGGPGAWYGSSQEQGAWAELLRHHQGPVSPLDMFRRVARVRITGLLALDLTSDDTCRTLGVSSVDLTGVGYEYRLCQSIAARAWQNGHEGILAPSGALPGQRTVVVFDRGIHRLDVERERVTRMPNRLLDLLDRIPMPSDVRDNLEALVGDAIRSHRQWQAAAAKAGEDVARRVQARRGA